MIFHNFRKRFRKWLWKKRLTYIKISDHRHVRSLPERPPRVRTSQARNNSSSSKCCSNSFPLHFAQQMFEHVVWIGLHCKCCKKCSKEMKMNQCQEHITRVRTRPWPRPGELCLIKYWSRFPGSSRNINNYCGRCRMSSTSLWFSHHLQKCGILRGRGTT